jgi:mevalonate kinase
LNFYSNGKLLLTGEYLVLHGAKALAFPVSYGQDLRFSISSYQQGLKWIASEPTGIWFEANLTLPDLAVKNTSSQEKVNYLRSLLLAARKLNPDFLMSEVGVIVETNANFPVNWGLGTSSTLINNVAQWAGVNAFDLHQRVSKGSGYDIACAGSNHPILYQRNKKGTRTIESLNFKKSFLKNLYFVYSGKKRSTENIVSSFSSGSTNYSTEIKQINTITKSILESHSLDNFISLINRHEQIIGNILSQKPIREERYVDFNGAIKSLGAWGGDFLLIATPFDIKYVKQYFEQFELSVIIPFKKMMIP